LLSALDFFLRFYFNKARLSPIFAPQSEKVMFAIVEIAGQQFKVEKDQKIFVHRIEGEAGTALQVDRVLLTADGSNVVVGTPTVSGAQVSATILGHFRGEKVRIFKKKRRKTYRKTIGHRQHFTQIQINSVA
jgi:large subunit ribosomal protein L21